MPRPIAALALPALSGVLFVLCFPGFNHGQLAWLALVPLLLSLEGAVSRAAFARGFLAGLVAGLGTLSWVYPVCRAGGVNVAVSVLAWAALSAYCALYWGAFSLAARRFHRRHPALRPFAVAAMWCGLELLRSHLLTGFPWLFLAHSQWDVPQHLPLAEAGGAGAVSFMIALFNGALAEALPSLFRRRWREGRAAMPAAGALVLMVAASVQLSRRYRAPEGPSMSVAVVQGNVDQYKKWDREHEEEIAAAYARLTREAAAERPDLIVWPETAVPGWLPNDPRWMKWASGLAREAGTHLLAGAVTRDGGDYNAAFLFDSSGTVVGRYRKRHLVPFGEFVPFKPLFGRMADVLNALGNFESSDDWTVFQSPGGAFGVNICFESLFPGLVRGFVRRGAGVTINLTNDGWFLDTAAAEQHFAAAPFRAVENRTWFVAATNTGVSALVSPEGRVAARLPPREPGVLRGRVVPDGRGTFYSRHGDLFSWFCSAVALLCLL